MSATSSASKPSSAVAYGSGQDFNEQTTGTLSTGGWGTSAGQYFTQEILDSIPAPVNATLPLTNGIVRLAPQSYAVTLSLSANGYPSSITLSPTAANALNTSVSATSPQSFVYQFRSRQTKCVTCSTNPNDYAASCNITAVARTNGTEVTITNPRAANLFFAGATQSGSEGSKCSLIVTVLP